MPALCDRKHSILIGSFVHNTQATIIAIVEKGTVDVDTAVCSLGPRDALAQIGGCTVASPGAVPQRAAVGGATGDS